MGIRYKVVKNLNDLKDLKLIDYCRINKKPVAFLIKKGSIKKNNVKFQNKNINDILRSEFIIKLLNKISNNDNNYIFSLIPENYFSYEMKIRLNLHNFYLVGGMGHTGIVTLGYSLKNKKKILFV